MRNVWMPIQVNYQYRYDNVSIEVDTSGNGNGSDLRYGPFIGMVYYNHLNQYGWFHPLAKLHHRNGNIERIPMSTILLPWKIFHRHPHCCVWPGMRHGPFWPIVIHTLRSNFHLYDIILLYQWYRYRTHLLRTMPTIDPDGPPSSQQSHQHHHKSGLSHSHSK
jgi:hypothetical protein